MIRFGFQKLKEFPSLLTERCHALQNWKILVWICDQTVTGGFIYNVRLIIARCEGVGQVIFCFDSV